MGPARRRRSGLYHANPFLGIAIVIIITRRASLSCYMFSHLPIWCRVHEDGALLVEGCPSPASPLGLAP